MAFCAQEKLAHIPIIPVSWELAVKTLLISLRPDLVAIMLCPGQEKHTMREMLHLIFPDIIEPQVEVTHGSHHLCVGHVHECS